MDYQLYTEYNHEKDCWEASVSGEIDIFNSGDFKDALTALIKEKQIDIVLKCSKLEYIDSMALGALVTILKSVKAYGGTLTLLGLKPNIVKLFKITNLDKLFVMEGWHEQE